MAITIEAKPLITKVTIGDYGEFDVRMMGAATEAEIRRLYREADTFSKSILKKHKTVLEKEKSLMEKNDTEALSNLRGSREFMEAKKGLEESVSKMIYVKQFAASKRRELFSCDEEKRLKRLFDELSEDQVDSIYTQVVAELSNSAGGENE